MEIVKKNILSVVCGVIALVALVALVWPVSGMYADQQGILDKRKQVDIEAANMIKAPRFWPVIPDMQSGEKTQLKQFPTDEIIKKGIEIKDQVHDQAGTIGNEIVRDNAHKTLIADILPNPRDLRFSFQQAYLAMVQDGPKGYSQLRQDLEATTPPTDQDVLDEAARMWNADYKGKILIVGGVAANAQNIQDDWQKACAGLQPKMRLAAAQRAKMYVEPGWLSIQKEMLVPGNSPKDPDIWYAQNMLWVQLDLVDAIKRLNANATSVQDATIKHIYQMSVPDDAAMYVFNPGAGSANGGSTEVAKVFSISETGRVSNSLYDVVQFQLVMNVDAARIPIILTELQRGKLITILSADHTAVDGIAAADNGFIYGDVPVARLSIRGEELFLRDWTTKLMPASIQQGLGVTPAPPK
jgi:hypothetical protein